MTTLTGLPNVWSDFLYGPNDYDVEDHATRNQEVYRLLQGLPDWGRPVALTQYDGDGIANELSSTDATNGIGLDAYSQNTTYRLEIRNSGMNIYGAPTLQAFTVGSVLFVGASKVLSQDNTNFFWDDAADTLKAKNLIVPTKAAIGSAALGTETAVITGTASVTLRMGIGTGADATIALLVNGTAQATRLGLGVAPDATAVLNASGNVIITGNIVNDTTTFVTDATNNKVGIGAVPVSTDPMLQVAGNIRATAAANPTTGSGVELSYITGGTPKGVLIPIDRATAAIKEMDIYGAPIVFLGNGAEKMKIDNGGIGVFTHAVAGQASDWGTVSEGTADATYGNSERDSINEHSVAINAIRTALRSWGWVA